MSSIIGHSLIGAALGDNAHTHSKKEKIITLIFFAFLAISLDFDYIVEWVFDLHVEPRYSHSIFGCAMAFSIGCFAKKYIFRKALRSVSYLLIGLAPITHVVCDYFVGVHKNPVLWPFDSALLAFPYGLLPSAGRLDIHNYYFWRNLAIELGIFLPIASILSRSGRGYLARRKLVAVLLIVSFGVFVIVAFNLKR